MSLTLQLNVNQTDDGKSLVFFDLTGAYTSINAGGWGAPNQATTDALTATITITLLTNPDTLTFGPTYTASVYNQMPNSSGVPVYVSAQTFGLGTGAVFPDGVYKITYLVTGISSAVAFSATTTGYFAITPAVDCCYKKIADEFATCSCNCDETEEKLIQIARQHGLMERAEDCGDAAGMFYYIQYLQNLCATCGCGC
jgi:hypothetical protein